MFTFGVDYYPEHWPEERWPIDAGLMVEAGFNITRLAEFAWSRLEPQEGTFDFAWLDRAIDVLSRHDIRVILGTPTASPPAWLMESQPELYRVDEQGRRLTFGNRREYCPNHPLYHEHTTAIVNAMAEHYVDHRAVVGWQVDNEFGDRCYCPVCRTAFQAWLRERYGTLGALNDAWGTIFWSHVYTDWSQIPVPLSVGGSPNPGLGLDFARFASDSYVRYQQLQVDLLRARTSRQFVTHNFMGFKYDRINYFDLARPLDFVTWDNYPRTQWSLNADVDPSSAALAAATMRGLKQQPFWVMEQQAGSGGWEIVSVAPRPGELRLWSYQQIAHGADAIIFFRWRTARYGTEQYWHGLLDHDGTPGRRYKEIAQMGAEVKQVGDALLGTRTHAQVAMLLSYDSRFAFQVQPNNPGYDYAAHFHDVYRAFHDRNIAVDVASPVDDLSAYKLVVAPPLYVLSEDVAANLHSYVRGGGTLVCFFRSGVKDEANAIVNRRLPGLLAELCGTEVVEYDSLPSGVTNDIEWQIPGLDRIVQGAAYAWADILAPTTAEVIARYTQDFYSGRPAITINRYGEGKAVYVGAAMDAAAQQMLVRWLLPEAGLTPDVSAPQGVEVVLREGNGHRLLFVLNHTSAPQEVSLPGTYLNLLDGSTVAGRSTLGPRDLLLLKATP